MSVMSVQGIIDSNKLGIISPHEHVLIDIRNQFREFSEASKRALSEQKVGIGNLDVLSRNPYAIKDNLVLNDLKIAEEELLKFKKAGGDTIVDATPKEIGRDPEALRDISRLTGLNIIAGCGYYTYDTHPKDMNDKTVKDITNEILNDIEIGMNGTRIKAGVIGELGTSEEIHPNEKKVLIASAKAQAETGVAIIVHTYPWGKKGLEVLDILSKNGAKLNKVSICHVDVEIDLEYCKEIIKSGAYIEFDNFGKEYYIDKRYRGFAGGVFARDIERVKAVKDLVDSGYLSNILISCDVCLKTLLHKYGGWGYDHILNNIVPMMREEGITEEQIDILLKENPKRFLEIKI